MTRLQKKCLIAAAGAHLLVVVVLFCSGFITSKPPQDDAPVLTIIPDILTDGPTSNSGKTAPTPPPTPVVKPVEPTPPVPEPPKPVVTPPPQVKPEPIKPPEEVKPVDKPEIKIPPPKPAKHEIKVNKTLVTVDQKKVADDAAAEQAKAEREAKRLRDQKLKAIQTAVRSIKANATAATVVDTSPGTASVSYANYASVVKSIYEAAWTPPDDASSDDANVKVSVTISNDGRVLDAHVIDASGDAQVDGSVRRTLDKVNFIAPFPEGAKEKERTFKINFNLKAKRMFG